MAAPLVIGLGVAGAAYFLTKGAKVAPKTSPKPAAPVEENPGSASGSTSPTTDSVRAPVTSGYGTGAGSGYTAPAGSTVKPGTTSPTTTTKPAITTADATIQSACPTGTRCATPVSYSTYKAPTTTTSEPTPSQTSYTLRTSLSSTPIYW